MSNRKKSLELMKSIALYKAENPYKNIAEIANHFKVSYHRARYSIDKFAKDISLLKGNAKGRTIAAKILSKTEDEIDLLKNQTALILAQINVNDKMPVLQRTELLTKITKIKKMIQEFELESHLKRADANIIAAIIKRFLPDASNDEIIKIYYEEIRKMRQNSD